MWMRCIPSSECYCLFSQVYSKVSGEPLLKVHTIDVSSKEFYGEGYDDSDKRILDMTIINKQLGSSAPLVAVVCQTSDSPSYEVAIMINHQSCLRRMESKDIAVGPAGINFDIPAQDICTSH